MSTRKQLEANGQKQALGVGLAVAVTRVERVSRHPKKDAETMMGKIYLLEPKSLLKASASGSSRGDLWSSSFLLRFPVLIVGACSSLQSTSISRESRKKILSITTGNNLKAMNFIQIIELRRIILGLR